MRKTILVLVAVAAFAAPASAGAITNFFGQTLGFNYGRAHCTNGRYEFCKRTAWPRSWYSGVTRRGRVQWWEQGTVRFCSMPYPWVCWTDVLRTGWGPYGGSPLSVRRWRA